MGAAAAARTVARFRGKDVAEVLGRYTAPDEVIELPGSCHACGDSCATRMYRTEIPFFKASQLPSQVPSSPRLKVSGVFSCLIRHACRKACILLLQRCLRCIPARDLCGPALSAAAVS